jgi:hypothetical protein
MPLIVTAEEIQPGMKLAEAFFHKGRMMLAAGKLLTRSDVELVQKHHAHHTFKIGDPLLDSICQFEDDSREREVAGTATQQIAACVDVFQQRMSGNVSTAGLNVKHAKQNASAVIEFVQANPVSAALIKQTLDPSSYVAQHAGNVFYLSILLGTAVRDYVMKERARMTNAPRLTTDVSMNLLPLGLGAMLMDLSLCTAPHLFEPDRQLTDDDREFIRKHPQLSANLLPDDLPTGTKMVVLTHHENLAGRGYPRGVPAEQQHIFTRIVRLCDAFDASISNRVYRKGKSTARALWEVTAGPARHFYDPVLTKVFASLIQPFPIGAKLKLIDGRTAVVVKYNRKQPFYPYGIICFDESGRRLAPHQCEGPLELGTDDLKLKAFGEECLSFLYDPLPPPAQFEGADFVEPRVRAVA